MKIGDRVKINMTDATGNPLYGTIVDSNFLGIAVLVECETPVDKRYCYTDSSTVMFLKDKVEVIK